MADVCPRCEGRGWVVERDGSAGSARPCDCRGREDPVPSLLAAAGIPARYQPCSLDEFKPGGDDSLVAAREISRRYIDEFIREDGGFNEAGLLYIGPPGVGKTHLAVAVLKELIRRYRVRGLFVDFTALIHQIQSTFDPSSSESKHQVLDPVTDAEVLVLDELGAQKPTPWVNEILYLVMNARYTARLTTLFTTNFRLDTEGGKVVSLDRGPAAERHGSLASRIPPNLLSRLYEMAWPVVIDADDYRRDIKMHRHRM